MHYTYDYGYQGKDAYTQSKQADRMLTWAQARVFAGAGITANAVHPGSVDTAMLRHSTPSFRGLPVDLVADTVTWLAASMGSYSSMRRPYDS